MKYLIILLFLLSSLLHANEKVTLQLKWFHQFQFAGYYAAKEKGFYEEAGLEVEIKQRDLKYNNIEQVIDKEANYGVSDSILMLYKAKNKPVVIVSPIFQHSANVLITLKNSELNSPYKLQNKNLLFYPNDTDGFSLLGMLKKLNIDVELLRKREQGDYQKLITNEVDAMPAYLGNEPYYFEQKGIDINIINPTNYGLNFYGDMLFTSEDEMRNHPNRVKKFKNATLKGWVYALENKEEIIQLIKSKYNSQKSLEHLRYEAKVIDSLISKETIPLGTLDEGRIQYILDIYKTYGFSSKSVDIESFIFEEFTKSKTFLSLEENKKIANKTFNVYITNWEPFTISRSNSDMGLSIDILKNIESKSNLSLNYIHTKNFVEALSKIKEDKNGLILATSKTKGKEAYASFTNSYVSFPISIATKVDKNFIIDLKELEGKRVAVGKNYTAHLLLKKNYPLIDFVLVDNTREALNLLANDKVYAAADILPVLNYTINKYSFGDLKVSGTSDFNFDVRFMLNKQNSEFIPIFNKLIDGISEEDKQKIINKWIYTKHIKTVDYSFLFWVFLVVAVVFAFMYYRQMLLKKNKEQIKNEKQRYETILDLAYDGLHILNKEGKVVEHSTSFAKMLGCDFEEVKSFYINDWDVNIPKSQVRKAVKELLNKSDIFETKYKQKDGTIIDVQVSAKKIEIDNEVYLYASAKDITELKRKEKTIKNYLELIDENIITSSTDLSGTITSVSEAFCHISGYSKEELIGSKHSIIRHSDMPKELFVDLWETILSDRVWKGEIQNKKKNGDEYWVNVTISPAFDDNGIKVGYSSVRQDITDKKTIEKISITDGLTGIYNRRHFNDMFPRLIDSTKRDDGTICFLIMDIDHFKQYNDTYGHQMGDKALVSVAKIISSSLNRADDYGFRLGGEEFGIIFKAKTKEKAKLFADKFKQNIENLKIEHENNSASNYITASMGLVFVKANEIESIKKIYKEADELLYKAKETGRNRVCINL